MQTTTHELPWKSSPSTCSDSSVSSKRAKLELADCVDQPGASLGEKSSMMQKTVVSVRPTCALIVSFLKVICSVVLQEREQRLRLSSLKRPLIPIAVWHAGR
uniref:Uncharacterized protein n=1 Tax=Rhipicephalus microplus TaxID=6941 RepID=A0A6G5AH17_RHIMP